MSIKKPVFYEYDVDKMKNLDLISVGHVDNSNNSAVELRLVQNGEQVDITGAEVTARVVTRKTHILINDNVQCSVNERGNIIIPFDRPNVVSGGGDLRIEVNITDVDSELTLQFPLWVRVNPSILENAELSPESTGTIPELIDQITERLDGCTSEEDVLGIIDEALSAAGNEFPKLTVELYQGSYWLTYYDSENGDAHRTVNLSRFFLSSHQDITGKVDKTTTIAGVDLQDNITASELKTALNVPAVDDTLTNGGNNPVKGSAIFNALAGKLKYVDAAAESLTVNECTAQDTIYKVYINSGVVTGAFTSLICVRGNNKWIQYAFTPSDFIIFRSGTVTNGEVASSDWSSWDYVPTHSKTSELINNALSGLSIPSKTSELTNDSGFLTSHQSLSGLEATANKVTSMSGSSTDTQYPSAKAVYTALSGKADKLGNGTNNEVVITSNTGMIGRSGYEITDNPLNIGNNSEADTYIPNARAVGRLLAVKESSSNKVTSLSSSSTDNQYPSAKCVYDLIGNIETLLSQV